MIPEWIVQLLSPTIVVGLMWAFYRGNADLRKEVGRHRFTLYGEEEDRSNGVRGNVKDLDKRMTHFETELQALQGQLEFLNKDIGRVGQTVERVERQADAASEHASGILTQIVAGLTERDDRPERRDRGKAL